MEDEKIKVLLKITTGYERKYLEKYHDIIPRLHPVPICKESERENIYKKALEEDITWQEVTGFNNTEDIIL